MNSLTTIDDDSTLTKSFAMEEDEGVISTVMGLKDKLNYLVQEVENQSAIISQKDLEIKQWKSKAEEEEQHQKTIFVLEEKLQKVNNQVKELKELLTAQEFELKTKYIEKSQHNKELIDSSAKINYLTSENQRLNSLIMEKLESLRNKEDLKVTCQNLERQNKELLIKVDGLVEVKESLEKTRAEDLKIIQEWKEKYNELETNNFSLKIRLEENIKDLETLRQINEDKDKQLKCLNELKGELLETKKEKEKQKTLLDEKEKELEKIKLRMMDLENKEAELEYLRERVSATVKENGEIHKTVMEKSLEADECRAKLNEWKDKIEMIEGYEKKISILTKEKEDLEFKFKQRNDLLERAKISYTKLYHENNELLARVEYLTQENEELKEATVGYAEMIADLKNTVLKGEYADVKMLDFGSR